MLEPLFDNIAGLNPAAFLKKDPNTEVHRGFPVKFAKILEQLLSITSANAASLSRFSSSVLNVRTSFLTLRAERQVTCGKITRKWKRAIKKTGKSLTKEVS